jgi:hypothetical protein
LPTEAEWEYACRAGLDTPFNTGASILNKQANFNNLLFKRNNDRTQTLLGGITLPVGQFSPNRWGLYDMHGNRMEWCWDWYGTYSQQAQTDPAGASSGEYRIARGGSCRSKEAHIRSAYRGSYTPSNNYSLGIRLVRSAGTAQKNTTANASVQYSRINAERKASHTRWVWSTDSQNYAVSGDEYSDPYYRNLLEKNNIDMTTFKARFLDEYMDTSRSKRVNVKRYVLSIMENTSGTMGILLNKIGLEAYPVYE